MSQLNFEEGGMCYIACEELFEFFNNCRFYCYKGCDFGTGRVNDPVLRREAEKMCKRYASEVYNTQEDLDEIKDLRVTPFMHPTQPSHVYKACLAGIRRQRY